jgi:hypothetical protein
MAATDNALRETIGTPNCYWLGQPACEMVAVNAHALDDVGSVMLDY